MPRDRSGVPTPNGSIFAPGGGYWPPEAYNNNPRYRDVWSTAAAGTAQVPYAPDEAISQVNGLPLDIPTARSIGGIDITSGEGTTTPSAAAGLLTGGGANPNSNQFQYYIDPGYNDQGFGYPGADNFVAGGSGGAIANFGGGALPPPANAISDFGSPPIPLELGAPAALPAAAPPLREPMGNLYAGQPSSPNDTANQQPIPAAQRLLFGNVPNLSDRPDDATFGPGGWGQPMGFFPYGQNPIGSAGVNGQGGSFFGGAGTLDAPGGVPVGGFGEMGGDLGSFGGQNRGRMLSPTDYAWFQYPGGIQKPGYNQYASAFPKVANNGSGRTGSAITGAKPA